MTKIASVGEELACAVVVTLFYPLPPAPSAMRLAAASKPLTAHGRDKRELRAVGLERWSKDLAVAENLDVVY